MDSMVRQIGKVGYLTGVWLFRWITVLLLYLDALPIRNLFRQLSVLLGLVQLLDRVILRWERPAETAAI
jgi:hypothetical protein